MYYVLLADYHDIPVQFDLRDHEALTSHNQLSLCVWQKKPVVVNSKIRKSYFGRLLFYSKVIVC